MFIKNMTKRERYIALTTVLLIGIAIIYAVRIDPIAKEWQTLNNEMKAKSAALKRDLNMLYAKASLETNYSKFAKYVKSDKSEEETAADLLSYLESLSRSDSCLVINIKPIGTKDFTSYKELLIDLSSEGSLQQFTKFLYDVENTKNMILKVRHFVLTSKAGQEGALKGSFLISKIIVE